MEKRHIDLSVRTCFSHFESVVEPREVVAFAEADGAEAVAITDSASVRGFPALAQAVRNAPPEFKGIYGVRLYCRGEEPFPVTVLARNPAGLRNLFRLVSAAGQHFSGAQWPCVTREDLGKFRDGLLVGRTFTDEDLWEAGKQSGQTLTGALEKAYRDFDYAEILPPDRYLIEDTQTLRSAAACLQQLGKLPAAVSCGNCITQEDKLCAKILCSTYDFLESGQREDAFPLKTTEEFLSAFAEFGDLAQTVVLDNPALLAEKIEKFDPFAEPVPPFTLPFAEERVRALCLHEAERKYGSPLPETVEERLNVEFEKIAGCDGWSGRLLMHLLADKCRELGYARSCRGAEGSALTSHLLELTGTNPLPPHYLCPACGYTEWQDAAKYPSGIDLPPKRCPVCGETLRGEGQNIFCDFAFGAGRSGHRAPEMMIPEEARPVLLDYLDEIFGAAHVFEAGVPSALSEDVARQLIECFEEYTGTKVENALRKRLLRRLSNTGSGIARHPGKLVITAAETDIFSFCPPVYGNPEDAVRGEKPMTGIAAEYLQVETACLFPSGMLSKLSLMERFSSVPAESIRPETVDIPSLLRLGFRGLPVCAGELPAGSCSGGFSELVRLYGRCHGSFDDPETPERAVVFRDAVMEALLKYGVDRKTAFETAEYVGKGKAYRRGFPEERTKALRARGVPEALLEELKTIRYLFPKAHAAEYLTDALRMAWYKENEPAAFYAAVLSVDYVPFSDCGVLAKGPAEIAAAAERVPLDWECWDNNAVAREKEMLALALECVGRGITFLPADDTLSDGVLFLPENGNIRLPKNNPRFPRPHMKWAKTAKDGPES